MKQNLETVYYDGNDIGYVYSHTSDCWCYHHPTSGCGGGGYNTRHDATAALIVTHRIKSGA
jgi:hypothetical protein